MLGVVGRWWAGGGAARAFTWLCGCSRGLISLGRAPLFVTGHHGLKHLPGWECEQGEDGELTFTTPTGRRYKTRPPNTDGTGHPTI
jgi:hypothetical protein